MEFIQKQPDCTFDFFYHCWTLNENEIYQTSPWRTINKDTLVYTKNTDKHIQELYNPILYEYENQNDLLFYDIIYKDTIAYRNTSGQLINNINNLLYVTYSRNKARNLLNTYLEKMSSIKYDFTMFVRFDISVLPKIQFNELDTSKVYVPNILLPREIIYDSCIISPTHIFLEWFNAFDILRNILDDRDIANYMLNINEELLMCHEQLVFAMYIYKYKNIKNISYFEGGLV